MEKLLMIENKLNELFNTIENSSEYKAYLEIGSVLEKNKKVNDLVKEIKKLQQESVRLEYNNDPSYKEVDNVISEKVKILNAIPEYQEYLSRMNELNDILSLSSNNIEEYINSKV